MKILADENISRLLVERLRYDDKLLQAFTVIMPQGVRIRPL